jgi:diacylglycerol kinase family enzyme
VEKVLLVANPNAGSVSKAIREVIVKALEADFKLEVADTRARNHAKELAEDAVDRDFDAVIAFGGDGTVNEVAQGLVHTDVALGVLPGGSTNVLARSLGIPRDPIEATAFLAHRLRSRSRRSIHVGRVDERYFLFSVGMGLDAEVVRRVEADPEAKRARKDWFFISNAVKAASTTYRGADPMITLEVEGHEPTRVVLAVCCNGWPFTFLKRFPVDVTPQVRLDGGLDVFALRRIRAVTIPRVAWALLVSRSHVRWRQGVYHHDISGLTLTADRPLPMQVDGDYIGERDSAHIELLRDALPLVL